MLRLSVPCRLQRNINIGPQDAKKEAQTNSLSVLLKNPSCLSLTKSVPSLSNRPDGCEASAATSALLNRILPPKLRSSEPDEEEERKREEKKKKEKR